MAGIEKVCEYSGDYGAYDMYRFKQNHIQILPEFRKEFREEKSVLYVFKRRYIVVDKNYQYKADFRCINAQPTEEDWDSSAPEWVRRYENGLKVGYYVFYSNLNEYKESLKKRRQRLLMEYEYVLHVPSMQGEVSGCYTNTSTDMSAVVRKMRRLVGSRNLTVKHMDGDFYDFVNDNLVQNPV